VKNNVSGRQLLAMIVKAYSYLVLPGEMALVLKDSGKVLKEAGFDQESAVVEVFSSLLATIPDEEVRTTVLKHFQLTGSQYHLLSCTAKEATVDLMRFRVYVERCTTDGRTLTKALLAKDDQESERRWDYLAFEPKSDILLSEHVKSGHSLAKCHGMDSVTDIPSGEASGERRRTKPTSYGVYVEFSPSLVLAIDGLIGGAWNSRGLNKNKCFSSLEEDLLHALRNQEDLVDDVVELPEPDSYIETQTWPVGSSDLLVSQSPISYQLRKVASPQPKLVESLTKQLHIGGLKVEATYLSMQKALLVWLNYLKTHSNEQLRTSVAFLNGVVIDGLSSD